MIGDAAIVLLVHEAQGSAVVLEMGSGAVRERTEEDVLGRRTTQVHEGNQGELMADGTLFDGRRIVGIVESPAAIQDIAPLVLHGEFHFPLVKDILQGERDIVREQMNMKLRERMLSLLAKDAGVENPVIPKVETKRMTKEELEEQKTEKIKKLSAILDKLAVPPTSSPVQARNYAMASKPMGVRLAWVCNFKHALHSSPCGCAKPHLGGKWVVLGKNSTAEIKDDK